MVEDSDVRRDLLARIDARRASVQAHLARNRPRVRRRGTVTVVLSSIAALSTAGPALGGESFTERISTSLGLPADSVVWRVLCLGALVVSIAAAVLTNLGKTQDASARLSTVEAVDGELEGLSLLLEYGDLSVQDGVKLYQQYTGKVGFLDEDVVPVGVARSRPSSQPVVGDVAGDRASPDPSAHRLPRGLPAVPPPVPHRPGHLPPPPPAPRQGS
jgi:hypothetical protein